MANIDFSEVIWKMDKWAYDDTDLQEEFYEIVDDETKTSDEKIDDVEELLDSIIQDEDRLVSYLHNGDRKKYTRRALAIALIEQLS